MRALLGACLFFWLLLGPALGAPLARVKATLAPVTAARDSASEQVTQVMLWDPVQVVKVEGNWVQVVVPEQYRTEQGYPGWMKLEALAMQPAEHDGDWSTVCYPQVALRARADVSAPVVMQAYMSTRLPLVGQPQTDSKGERWHRVKLPDGGLAFVRASQVRAEVTPALAEAAEIVRRARLLEKTPYLWGGMSRAGIDCSGLTYVAYRMSGVTIPRDADQQFQVGQAVPPEELLPGDLVFFGEPGDITHVGIYAGAGTLVHASSGAGVVQSPLFEGWYKQYYRGARRILKDSAGGTRVLTPASR